MAELPYEHLPASPIVAISALAIQFVSTWVQCREIVDPGQRWQSLPSFDQLCQHILDEPELFYESYLHLRSIAKGAP